MRKTAAQITDRAKRYRANSAGATIQWGKKPRCHYCGTTARKLDVEHIDGNEANGDKANLSLACRPCNVRKGNAFKRAKIGKRTRQYNPGNRGAQSWQQYISAALALRGQGTPDSMAESIALMQRTPHAKRSEFAGHMQENPGAKTLGEYMDAVISHTRHAHDAGGKIIHETPKARRKEFASAIWAKRQSASQARRDEVPF